jgi:hypothetical protein
LRTCGTIASSDVETGSICELPFYLVGKIKNVEVGDGIFDSNIVFYVAISLEILIRSLPSAGNFHEARR